MQCSDQRRRELIVQIDRVNEKNVNRDYLDKRLSEIVVSFKENMNSSYKDIKHDLEILRLEVIGELRQSQNRQLKNQSNNP